jgi:hypothetical protein
MLLIKSDCRDKYKTNDIGDLMPKKHMKRCFFDHRSYAQHEYLPDVFVCLCMYVNMRVVDSSVMLRVLYNKYSKDSFSVSFHTNPSMIPCCSDAANTIVCWQ